MFDFANSSYTTMIVTFAYSVYFVETVVPGGGYDKETGDLLWGLSFGLSQGLVLITAPVLGAIADFSGAKKRFLLFTYLACVVATACLGFVGPGDIALGISLFVVSNVFYSSGENLIAAFLPEIAPPERMGRVSGLGWALGYFGGLASLALCFPFLEDGVGAANATSVRISFVVVATFFLLAGLPTFLFLRERAGTQASPAQKGYIAVGFARVFETLRHVRRYRQLSRFLFVFLSYNCGIIIVVAFAVIYAKRELGMTQLELLWLFIILQVSASVGAFVLGVLQDRLSSKFAIQVSLILWLAVCVGAYATESKPAFYLIANVAGLAMGSAQSAGRALVGTFSPSERSGEFFGFWGLFWKLSGLVGPPLFGLASASFGMRTAILLTGTFFVLGMVGMLGVDEAAGRQAAMDAEAKNSRLKRVMPPAAGH